VIDGWMCVSTCVFACLSRVCRAWAQVKVVRKELIHPDNQFTDIWNHLEGAMEAKHLVTCRRVAADPFSDKNTDRLGIKLGTCYQVIDCVSAHAKPTGTKDALDVGMVCIRNMHAKDDGGRFVGRWCYGHPAWAEYPEIGRDMAARTEDIETNAPFNKRMIADKIEETKNQLVNEAKAKDRIGSDSDDFSSSDDESEDEPLEDDTVEGGDESKSRRSASSVGKDGKKKKKKKNKDKGKKHYDPFSDIALSSDSEEDDNFSIDKFLKAKVKIAQPGVDGLYWMQIEDFVELFNRVYVLEDIADLQENLVSRRFASKWVPGDYIVGSGGPPTDPADQESESESDESVAASVKKKKEKDKSSEKPDKSDKSGDEEESSEEESEEESSEEESESDESDNTPADPFTDNPMYPFTVGEPTHLSISLFQADRRWTVSRLGQANPGVVTASSFAVRGARIEACMNYERAIGFVLLNLSGAKVRVTTFTPERIVDSSEYIQFTNTVSKLIHLDPGRYCIVPFMDVPVDNKIVEYILRCSFREGTVEFEVKDLVKERPIDDMPSDDEDEAEQERKVQLKKRVMYGKCPMLVLQERWEWEEQLEELGNIAIYEQVSDLAYLLRAMKKEVRNLQDAKLKSKAREALQEKKLSLARPVSGKEELLSAEQTSGRGEPTVDV